MEPALEKKRILIVEDEILAAKAIELYLSELDYLSEIASNDLDAFEKTNTFKPHLILMDITLHGSSIDGIDLSRKILKIIDIPIVFITAYCDDEIIDKAKKISPYGYLLKPIELKDIQIVVAIALQKHETDKKIREKESWLKKSISSINEGFIATNKTYDIKFMNKVAENLTGFKEEDVVGKKINYILNNVSLKQNDDNNQNNNLTAKFVKKIISDEKKSYRLISKNKNNYIITLSQYKIDEHGCIYGYIYVIQDITKEVNLTTELVLKNNRLKEMNNTLELEMRKNIRRITEEKNKISDKNEWIERELILARNIQVNLLPANPPIPNISFIYRAVEKIGGDFFDFVKFREPELLGVFLCDVSGHGISAAFLTTAIKNIILESGKNKLDPKQLLSHINSILLEKIEGNFITAFYGIYNSITKEFVYSNAGQNPPYLIHNGQIIKLSEDTFHLPLAVFEEKEHIDKNIQYKNRSLKFEKDTRLFLYTDGAIEIKSQNNDSGSFDIGDILKKYSDEKDNRIFLNNVFSDIVRFQGNENFEDDVTLICISG